MLLLLKGLPRGVVPAGLRGGALLLYSDPLFSFAFAMSDSCARALDAEAGLPFTRGDSPIMYMLASPSFGVAIFNEVTRVDIRRNDLCCCRAVFPPSR
mmetsp:Transcript_34986/g.56294  ORF Transcript_34986/g.56294 Transcript_34986/m.56294 type:complete len:98 (+) Transcript_34986:190-483(+)